MTILAAIVRVIGLRACLIVALLFFYEGIPGASRIPFLTSIPVIGDLTTGRVATERAKAADAARRACIGEAEKTALAAELTERDRQRRAGAIVIEEYRRRLEAAQVAEQAASDKLESEISAHEKKLEASGRACRLDDADVRWLQAP